MGLFVLLLLLSPLFSRYLQEGELLLLSTQSYHDLRISSYVQEHGTFPTYDALSYGGRPYVFTTIYPALLAGGSELSGIPLFYLILFLPVLCGVLSFLLLYALLERSSWPLWHRRLFLMLLVTSPLFIHLFSASNTHYLPALLLLCFLYLFRSSSRTLRHLSLVFLLFIPLFGYMHASVAIFVLVFFALSLRRRYLFLIVVFTLLLLLLLLRFFSHLLSFRLSSDLSSFSFLITDFGYVSGLSLFAVFLLVLGILHLSSRKEMFSTYFSAFCFSVVLFLLYFFIGDGILYYLNAPLIWYASHGFLWLVQFPYESSMMRSLILIVLFSSAIFVPVSYIHTTASNYPQSPVVDALAYLKSFPQGTVLSDPRHGILINTIAEKPNIADDRHAYAPQLKERLDVLDTLFHTRDITLVDDLFSRYDISYVFIDEEMRRDIWITDKEGLLFLLERSGRFQRIYEQEGILIYSYVSA